MKDAINALVAGGADIRSAAWVLPAWLAAHLSLARSSGAVAYPGITAYGGLLSGLPVLSYHTAEFSSDGADVVLIDGSGVAYAEEGAEISPDRGTR